MIDWDHKLGRVTSGRFVALAFISIVCCVPASVQAKSPSKPLQVGDKAPDFDLPIQGEDRYLSLSELVEDGPVVVIVLRGYPGYQCAFCTSQLGAMINRAKKLSSVLGDKPNRLVFVYPGAEAGLEGRAMRFLGSRQLPDPMVLVRDPGMGMISEWGLRWGKRRETAYPAAYLIGPGRQVKWAKISDSHAGRATVEDIVRAFNNQ
jgi:hypothetical protein